MSNIIIRPVIASIQALQVTAGSTFRLFGATEEGFRLEVTTGGDTLAVVCRLDWEPDSVEVQMPFHPGGGYSSACVRRGNHLEGSPETYDALLEAVIRELFHRGPRRRLDALTAADLVAGPFELGSAWRPLRDFHPVRPPSPEQARLLLGWLAEGRGKTWAAARYAEAIGRGPSAAYALSTALLHSLWLHYGTVAAPTSGAGAAYHLTPAGEALLADLADRVSVDDLRAWVRRERGQTA